MASKKKKIKVVHVIGKLGYGGAEKLLLDICRKINKDKFSVHVVSLQGGGALVEKFEAAGIPVSIMYKRFKGDLGITKKLAEWLVKKKPHVVHTHLFVGDFFGGQAALKAKVPVIISTKHDILHESIWRDRFGRMMRRKFTKIIAISEATKDYLVKTEKIPVENVEVIYNGIDVVKFYTKDAKLFETDELKLGSVGRLSKEKGHKHLIRASRFIKNRNWSLRLIGDGPLHEDLQRNVELLDLQDHVHFQGFVSDVMPELAKFDVFVLPSISEGLSLAVIEAALAGKFIIATNVGGVPEIIQDGKTGLLFKPKHIEQLVKHLNWVNDNRETASNMARLLQQEVASRFDINEIIHQYEDLYQKLV